jgi:YegS/Rv2252/BmrU family lipid kinase
LAPGEQTIKEQPSLAKSGVATPGPIASKVLNTKTHQFHRIGIVFNPNAGGLKGARRERLEEAVRTFEASGCEVTLFATPGPNRAGELARRAIDDGCDLILAAGGDGTINEAVNGIAGSHVIFGVLPSGTANVLANEIGLPDRPDLAARQILASTPIRIALGRLEQPGLPERYFVLMAGVGLDARIVYDLDLELKKRMGKLAYWHGGFRQFGRPAPLFRARVNDKEYDVSFALITRVRNYGGDFEIARQVKLTDNDFEVILFRHNQWHDYLRFFGAVMVNRLSKTDGVAMTRSCGIELFAAQDERIYIQTDGESVGRLPATITTVPNALTLLLPRRYLAR